MPDPKSTMAKPLCVYIERTIALHGPGSLELLLLLRLQLVKSGSSKSCYLFWSRMLSISMSQSEGPNAHILITGELSDSALTGKVVEHQDKSFSVIISSHILFVVLTGILPIKISPFSLQK